MRCAGHEYVLGFAHGMFMASAWGITPAFSSLIIIVPAITGRLVAVAPHQDCESPGHESVS